jgi:hypothetical protein
LSEKNDKNGLAKCLVVLSGRDRQFVYVIPENGNSDIKCFDRQFHLFNYWDNKTLVSEQMNDSINSDAKETIEKKKKKEAKRKRSERTKERIRSLLHTVITIVVVAVIVYFAMKNPQIHDTVMGYIEKGKEFIPK